MPKRRRWPEGADDDAELATADDLQEVNLMSFRLNSPSQFEHRARAVGINRMSKRHRHN